jgi:hypothetical protein
MQLIHKFWHMIYLVLRDDDVEPISFSVQHAQAAGRFANRLALVIAFSIKVRTIALAVGLVSGVGCGIFCIELFIHQDHRYRYKNLILQ